MKMFIDETNGNHDDMVFYYLNWDNEDLGDTNAIAYVKGNALYFGRRFFSGCNNFEIINNTVRNVDIGGCDTYEDELFLDRVFYYAP